MDKTQSVTVDMSLLHDISTATIYLMGLSFILGSMVTVLILLLLDLVRTRTQSRE